MVARAALNSIPAPVDPSLSPNLMAEMGAPGLGAAMPPPPPEQDPSMVVTPTDDGGVEIDVAEGEAERPTPEFQENLALFMDESALNALAEQVIEWKEADENSRADWYSTLTQGLELLGLSIRDRNTPFQNATGIVDTLMLEAVLRNQAQTCAELLPAAGPVKTQIIGDVTEEVTQRASRVGAWMNFYLLEGAPEWVESHEQMYLWRAIVGSVYTKTYQDPIKNRPVSPWLGPDQLIVSYYADPDMQSCTRLTEVMKRSYRELCELQISGFYRDIELTDPDDAAPQSAIKQKVDSITGVSRPQISSTRKEDKEYSLLEQHVELVLEGFEEDSEREGDDHTAYIPRPYIVTVEETSRKVLAVRRNWRDGDDTFQKLDYFVHHRLVAGLGHQGIGFASILGNPAKAATALQRQMIDAATLEMFPGGLRVKGMRFDTNNKMIGPCEFIEIDTGGLPINQAVSPMPYKGPSQWSFELWKAGRENAQSLGNMADISVGDGRQDAPVGTTLALLEAANRMMSATIKSAHRSLKRELKLFASLFGQYLPEKPYPFPVPGGQKAIMRQDFSDDIDVIPVSDPNITSYAQRVTRAEMLVRFAQQFPQVHDIREALRNMYVEAGVDERKIDKILPPPAAAMPTDPLTENQMALTGKPIAAAAWQDHDAHIKAHQVLSEQVPPLMAHIAEHLALAMRVNVERTLGITLPPPGTKLPPEIENRIAVLVSQALQALKSPQGEEPTPGQIAMADIQVEAQKVQAKLTEIETKAATEAFKARVQSKEAEADRRTQMAIAMMKEQTAQAKHRASAARKPTAKEKLN